MSARVEPEWALVTVAFVDIRGFTTFADRATAREAVDFLNAFFAVAIPIVLDAGGQVNKLTGDGLLAVFTGPSHATDALACGRALVEAVDAELGERCRIGVGINSGLVLLGSVGAAGVEELSVIGDPVNVAARVQDATRDLGEPLLLTQATRVLLDGEHPELEPCGGLTLKGKSAPTALHRVRAKAGAR